MFSVHDVFGRGAINFVNFTRDAGINMNAIITHPAINLGLD